MNIIETNTIRGVPLRLKIANEVKIYTDRGQVCNFLKFL